MREDSDETSPKPELAGPELLKTASARITLAAAIAMCAASAGYWQIAGAVSSGDDLSSGDRARLAESFSRGHGSLMPLAPDTNESEWREALRIPESEEIKLLRQISSNERALGWLTLWDNYDDDGDVVTVTAAGVTQTVPIAHVPVKVLVPYIPGQPVFVTGARDGGGGVTVAVELTTGPLPLPPLAVGQTVALPLQ